ncbi:hypothetical protein [Streptacidiphilus fuscans]|uniref:hypothetical protein n=1 Tax=Streptacidiphilus fuscans TaxID=2789292 RepID=UPI0038B4D6BE
MPENDPVTPTNDQPDQPDHYVLVLPDREAAEELAEKLTAEHPGLPEPELHRDALAGEDDAEDAQWLVVLTPPLPAGLTPAALDALAADHDGWLES